MKKPLLMIADEAFVCDYRADLTQLYAIGIILDEDNKSWIENNHIATFEMIRVDSPPL